MSIVLAFDIERSDTFDCHNTIGIGACVVDENLKELDSLLLEGFIPTFVDFEPRCWEQFWSKNQNKLMKLTKFKK